MHRDLSCHRYNESVATRRRIVISTLAATRAGWHRRVVGLYTRHQLLLLLALLAAGGVGLAIRHWRAAHPEIVTRLERFDLDERSGDEARVFARPGPRGPKSVPATGDAPPLDLNRATADDLARLPGVGASLAARIVATRQAANFESIDDLVRVKGLGRARIERLRPLLSVAESRDRSQARDAGAASPVRDAPDAGAEPPDIEFCGDESCAGKSE